MFEYDPLAQYHSLLRLGSSSGYPNLQYANPHPYQMAMAGIKRRQGIGPKLNLYMNRQSRLRGIGGYPQRSSRIIAS